MSTIEKVENHAPIPPQIPNELSQLARATLGQANPLVAAICYPHCPQIAGLYLDGVQPTKVYDPVVYSLTDYLTGKKLGRFRRIYLGLRTTRSQGLDALRFGLVTNGVLPGEESYTKSSIYGIDRDTGVAYSLTLPIERDQLCTLVSKISTAACATPNMPLGVLRGITICSSCEYWTYCFGCKNRMLTSAVQDQSTADSTNDWTFKSKSDLADAIYDE